MCLQRSVTFVEEVLQNIDLARDRQRSRVSVPGKSQTARKPLGQVGRMTGKTGQLKTKCSYGESRAEATLERVIWRELSAYCVYMLMYIRFTLRENQMKMWNVFDILH